MRAREQALQMAEAGSVSFDKARPLIGREESSAVAWQAHAHVRRCFYLFFFRFFFYVAGPRPRPQVLLLFRFFFLDFFFGGRPTRTPAGASRF
jgi:hypothetical protein